MEKLRRYTLDLQPDIYMELQNLANERQTTIAALLRRFIKLGLIVTEVDKTPDAVFIIRRGKKDKELVFL